MPADLRGALVDLRTALALLTVLPASMGQREGDGARLPGSAFAWFPLVGLALGLLLAGFAWLPLPPTVGDFGVILLWVGLTGGLHLDGFGDACDALFATTSVARRLEIMKDPRTGSWAVAGIVLLLLGKYVGVGLVSPVLLVVAAVAGRWAMLLAAWAFPDARREGMGGFFRQGLGTRQVVVASAIALAVVIGASFFQSGVLVALIIAPITLFGVATFARSRLDGGLTGDIYGAICEVTELAILIVAGVISF